MPGPRSDDAWWLAPRGEIERDAAGSAQGLTQSAAEARLRSNGPNRFVDTSRRPAWLQFLARFRNPLVLLLVAASALSALTGDVTGFLIILAMVLLSVSIDFAQEFRAGRVADRLRQSVALRAKVLRDGAAREIPVAEVVAGDVVLVTAGDLVPADALVIEAKDCFVQQSLLTGESYPVEKHAGVAPADPGLEGAVNAIFMGSSVISGSATGLVVRTGNRTAMGSIAGTLARTPPPNAFEIGTRRFGLLIMRLTLLLVLFVLLLNGVLGKPWPEAFLFAIALAVGLTPELLPMVVSVTLAVGALRMSKRRVVVRRLSAIQNLGSMDVLCTDKTGTLTEARIRLEKHLAPDGTDSARVLELAYLNSRFETGVKSPLDDAILAHADIDVGRWTKVDEVPFDFERRRVSVLLDDGQRRLLVVKGAAEEIVRLCAFREGSASEAPAAIDETERARILAMHDALADDGFRVLGIACKEVGRDHPHAVVGDESELVFVGFAAFLDPPKTEAAQALRALAASGVAVKIVTGDNERVTQHVCGLLGVEVAGVVTGAEIAALDDPSLRVRAERANLFCRVNPAQKGRVIQALKASGHVVGYLGDGINDAPPLHLADVGLSVDTAVDIAREAADMILLEHDLGVLHEGVLEGRRTYGNIMKYIMMGTSSNFGNMFSMAGASALLPFLPMRPAQILLNNMLYDLSEIPIPTDRVDEAELAKPRAWDMDFIRNFMWVVGPVSSLFDFLTFYVLLAWFHADERLFQTGWFIESLATQVLVVFIIRTRGNPLASRPSPWLAMTALAIVAAAAVLPLTPVGAWFGFVAPPPAFYAAVAVMAIAYLILVEVVKRAFYRRYHARRSRSGRTL
jgi:Mg2+-importing ATPase